MDCASKFRLGNIVASSDVMDLYGIQQVDLGLLLDRHQSGDWGQVDRAVCRRNQLAMMTGATLTSVYDFTQYRIRIVTGNQHRFTTVSVMDPDEG